MFQNDKSLRNSLLSSFLMKKLWIMIKELGDSVYWLEQKIALFLLLQVVWLHIAININLTKYTGIQQISLMYVSLAFLPFVFLSWASGTLYSITGGCQIAKTNLPIVIFWEIAKIKLPPAFCLVLWWYIKPIYGQVLHEVIFILVRLKSSYH